MRERFAIVELLLTHNNNERELKNLALMRGGINTSNLHEPTGEIIKFEPENGAYTTQAHTADTVVSIVTSSCEIHNYVRLKSRFMNHQ